MDEIAAEVKKMVKNIDQLRVPEPHLHAAFCDGFSWRTADAGRRHWIGRHPFGRDLGRRKDEWTSEGALMNWPTSTAYPSISRRRLLR